MLSRPSPYWLWFLFALPALGMIQGARNAATPEAFAQLLHPSGKFAARFMIVAMMATPLSMVLRGWRGPRWLVRHRRTFGVAAFGYAALHTVLYVIGEADITRIVAQAATFEIWTGWIAFTIFLPLAATSNNYAMRVLGPRWKVLQRWTYAAAVLTLMHWASLHDWGGVAPALVYFAPVIGLSAYRFWWNFLRPRPIAPA